MAHLLFPFGVRLTTWLGIAAFVAVGFRDRRAFYACAVWLVGFEAAFSVAKVLFHQSNILGPMALAVALALIFYLSSDVGARDRVAVVLVLVVFGVTESSALFGWSGHVEAVWCAVFYVGAAVLLLPAVQRMGVSPSLPLLGAAVSVGLLWLVTGFHVNGSMDHFNALGEVLNDSAKTLWAAAYLVPLFAQDMSRVPAPTWQGRLRLYLRAAR